MLCAEAARVHYYTQVAQAAIQENCMKACGRCEGSSCGVVDSELIMPLTAHDGERDDQYGGAVALSGDATVALGGAAVADVPNPDDCDPIDSDCSVLHDHGVAYAVK